MYQSPSRKPTKLSSNPGTNNRGTDTMHVIAYRNDLVSEDTSEPSCLRGKSTSGAEHHRQSHEARCPESIATGWKLLSAAAQCVAYGRSRDLRAKARQQRIHCVDATRRVLSKRARK
ncbi:hypothetical protein A0H81_01822 [Grifola frondosa]|uniref:Uncharacterized protein n=1 Tax=Grifola frondosa TaxID=5627 RepID=A0A1C7MLV6_GRIFR|nr:hypothetical protein A0H81_01822 [Grifola frondosa]